MIEIQRKLKRVLALPKKEDREEALRKLAQSLGCSLQSSYTSDGKHLEDEMVRRIQEAARSRRESWLWLLALISAIAAAISALAAWWAVLS